MRLLPLVFASMLVPACDAAPATTTCELVNVTPRGLAWNGMTFNGAALKNGVFLQAMTLNGIFYNGIHYNGINSQGIDLRGTTLVATDADGTQHPVDLVGGTILAKTDAGDVVELTIDDAESDPDRADITYYALSHDGENVCGLGGRGLFVAGTWDETGAHLSSDTDEFSSTFSCTDGVIAKCVMWGYTPYGVGPDAHQACTRLARADYCGDGVSYTRDGTEIDVFDQLGVQRPADDAGAFRFEAGWGPDGAVCVDAPRYEMVLPGGAELLPPCWEDLPRCNSESEAEARGAVLANRSRGDLRNVCEPF